MNIDKKREYEYNINCVSSQERGNFLSSKRQSRKYRPLRMGDCKPKKNRMDLLFDKTREREKERRGAAIIADTK